jgi:hypothetical protein
MDGILVDPLQLENEAGEIINPASNELLEAIHAMTARLSVLASAMNAGAVALRIIPIASVATSVSGSLTTVTGITNLGGVPAYTTSVAQQNMNAVLSNIQNVVIT